MLLLSASLSNKSELGAFYIGSVCDWYRTTWSARALTRTAIASVLRNTELRIEIN